MSAPTLNPLERYVAESDPMVPGAFVVTDMHTGASVGAAPDWEAAQKTAQQLNALAHGNERRLAAAAFKRRLKQAGRYEGCRLFAQLLSGDVPDVLAAMHVFAALTAIPSIGETKASELLRAMDVRSGARRVCQLTPRQREVLVDFLMNRAESDPTIPSTEVVAA